MSTDPTPPTENERHHAFEWLRELGLNGDDKTARLAYVAMQTMLSPTAVHSTIPASPTGEDGERGGGSPPIEIVEHTTAKCPKCGGEMLALLVNKAVTYTTGCGGCAWFSELSSPEGQRAPCPEAGNDGDALACPPSGGEPSRNPCQLAEPKPAPPDDTVEWAEAEWKRVWDSRKAANLLDQIIRPLAHRCRNAEKLVLITAKDARDTAVHRNQLMEQLAAAQERCREAEAKAAEQGRNAVSIFDECKKLQAQLAAAQARVAELEDFIRQIPST